MSESDTIFKKKKTKKKIGFPVRYIRRYIERTLKRAEEKGGLSFSKNGVSCK